VYLWRYDDISNRPLKKPVTKNKCLKALSVPEKLQKEGSQKIHVLKYSASGGQLIPSPNILALVTLRGYNRTD